MRNHHFHGVMVLGTLQDAEDKFQSAVSAEPCTQTGGDLGGKAGGGKAQGIFLCVHWHVEPNYGSYLCAVGAERDFTSQMAFRVLLLLGFHPSRCCGSRQPSLDAKTSPECLLYLTVCAGPGMSARAGAALWCSHCSASAQKGGRMRFPWPPCASLTSTCTFRTESKP